MKVVSFKWFFHLRLILASFLFLSFFAPEILQAQEDRPYLLPRVQLGKASFYCPSLHGNRTACGKVYNEKERVAAHPYYPFGTVVRVTNLANNRNVGVVIVDRGPARKHQKRGGIIDVSRGAARELGMLRPGIARVRLVVLEWGPHKAKYHWP